MAKGETLINAVIGAVVTIVLSFTGFSPILGGVVAGYLQREDRKSGAKVGALSGAIAFIPMLLFVFFFIGIFFTGGMGIPGGAELFIIALIMFPMFLIWNVGLGALGGYLAVYLREDLKSRDSTG